MQVSVMMWFAFLRYIYNFIGQTDILLPHANYQWYTVPTIVLPGTGVFFLTRCEV